MNNENKTINIEELGFNDCGENAWEFIDSKDHGDYGYETWQDPKTGKHYEIEWEKVRFATEAEELD